MLGLDWRESLAVERLIRTPKTFSRFDTGFLNMISLGGVLDSTLHLALYSTGCVRAGLYRKFRGLERALCGVCIGLFIARVIMNESKSK